MNVLKAQFTYYKCVESLVYILGMNLKLIMNAFKV